MTNKLVIFETKWAARDTNKEYPHGWGFMPPFVIFPQDMDVVACAEKCKIVLSNDEFACISVTPHQLIDMGYSGSIDNYVPATPEHVMTQRKGLNFGQALGYMHAGKKVQRIGWNGKGMWLALQMPDANSKMGHPYPYMKGVDGKLFPWTPNVLDLMADDYQLVMTEAEQEEDKAYSRENAAVGKIIRTGGVRYNPLTELAVTEKSYAKPATKLTPICYICNKELTILETCQISPYASGVTCDEHKEYQFMNQPSIAKALAGYSDGEFTQEQVSMFRNALDSIKADYENVLSCVSEHMPEEHREKVLTYIKQHVHI